MITPSFYKTLIHLTRGTGSLFQVYSRGWKKKQTHGKATATSPEQRDFPAVHWAGSWSHSSDLKQEWSGRSETGVNGMGVPEVSGAQGSGQQQQKGIPQHPTSIIVLGLCLGTVLSQSSEPRLSHQSLDAEQQRAPPGEPAQPCPGWQSCWGTGLDPASQGSERRTFRVVEHHLLVPWPWTHGQPPPPGAPLPRSSLTQLLIFPLFVILTAVLRCQSLTWFFRVAGVGKSVSALINTCLNAASPSFDIYSIS